MPPPPTQLIITTGDISDVDGFLALAHYAKSGADCMFVMNFPHYVGVDPAECDLMTDLDYEMLHPGQGYCYSADHILNDPDRLEKSPAEYLAFVGKYRALGLTPNEIMRNMLLDLSIEIVTRVWHEEAAQGKLFFCIGGVNNTNPFSRKAIKNDVITYAPMLAAITSMPSKVAKEGDIMECGVQSAVDCLLAETLVRYEEIYVDFNGSMAFYKSPAWRLALFANPGVVRGAFVMGGVLTGEAPKTKAAIPGILNRMSGATMNQMYDNDGALKFFEDCMYHKTPVLVTSNNAVQDFSTMGSIYQFMAHNGLHGDYLNAIAKEYYGTLKGAQKPFDFYCALSLVHFMLDPKPMTIRPAHLLFCTEYAVALISGQAKWLDALDEYKASIHAGVVDPKNRAALLKEIEILKQPPGEEDVMYVFNVDVFEVLFTLGKPQLVLRCDAGAAQLVDCCC